MLNAPLQLGLLRLADDLQTARAQVDLHRVGAVLHIAHGVGGDVLLRVAREAVDHREVALLDPLGRDLEVALRTVGDILLGVGGGLVILVGIDAEDGEVARVARPDPVVRVAAKLTDRRGRCTHQAHIVVLAIDKEELLVAVVHLLDRGAVALPLGLRRGNDRLRLLALSDAVGHLLHADQDAHIEPLVGELLLAVARPEAVGEVVVLDRGVELNGVVAAVVVRQHQALLRDDLSRAEAAKEHHGVLHRGLVDAVDVRFGQLEALCAHLADAVGHQARQPHALVGRHGQPCDECCQNGQEVFFHLIRWL